jgi:hypothetical protein
MISVRLTFHLTLEKEKYEATIYADAKCALKLILKYTIRK